jgi:ankyrin repeat protein
MRSEPLDAFIEASVWHGPLEPAAEILDAHPDIASGDLYAAAILGNAAAVARFLANDPAAASSNGGPLGWDALTYLCFSKYLRLDGTRSDGFLRAATMLLDAGVSANTGFWEKNHLPKPEWESALYGAAGVARHPELTRLLLERGADPNDEETPYHAPETYDNRALQVLVSSGKVNAESLATMLLRKADWHDVVGAAWLLEHGADPNRITRWQRTSFHHAILRDNAVEMLEVLLDHGADPHLRMDETTATALAARRGRRDVLELFDRRGLPMQLSSVDALLAACARNDASGARTMAERTPNLKAEIIADGGKLLAEFAGNGNTDGVRLLLELGADVDAPFVSGDNYWDVAQNSTALHVAAWRARHATVDFLIRCGATVDALDGRNRTPLMLAVRACVDSYWTDRRSPESVETLLRAGARAENVALPTGYDDVDTLLRRFRKGA